eukprot:2275792-Pyramimonas_sp.AAC.1
MTRTTARWSQAASRTTAAPGSPISRCRRSRMRSSRAWQSTMRSRRRTSSSSRRRRTSSRRRSSAARSRSVAAPRALVIQTLAIRGRRPPRTPRAWTRATWQRRCAPPSRRGGRGPARGRRPRHR